MSQALSDTQVWTANAKALKAWLKANSTKIKAKPNTAVFYSGNSPRLLIAKIEKEMQLDQRIKKATSPDERKKLHKEKNELHAGLFKIIKGAQAAVEKWNLPMQFDDIDAVLKRVKSHPKLIDKDQNEASFANMYDYAHSVGKMPDRFPKKELGKMWSALSVAFAKNAEGDIRILEGVEDDFRTVGNTKDFVNKELPELIKSKKLSKDSQATLSRIVGKYIKAYEGETKKLIKAALNEAHKLRKPL